MNEIIAAQIAYETYSKTVGFVNFQGRPLPKWSDLPPNIQQAWINAAAEVMNAQAGYVLA